MSCCCVCHDRGSKWCPPTFCRGCPGLNKDKKLHHAGVEYSPVPSIKPATPTLGDPANQSGVPSNRIRHCFMQPASQVGLPLQVGLPSGSEPVMSQPAAEEGASSRNDAVIQFLLHHDVMHSKLTVNLLSASNLPRKYDRNGILQCDTYVTLHLEPDRENEVTSKKVEGTCNPVFNERFLFGGFSMEYHQTLVLQIYNSALSNKAVGEVYLPLSEEDLFGVVKQMIIRTKEIKGHSSSEGDLHISLSWNPLSYKLEGIIHKATGLRKYDIFGLSDPFVKVKITVKDKQMLTWQTSVKYKTLAPEYNEQFSYAVTDSMKMGMDMVNMTISLDIYNHDRFKNDKMGSISIGKDAPTKLGRQHWAKVLKYPQQQISFWHPIQPPPSRSRGPSPIVFNNH